MTAARIRWNEFDQPPLSPFQHHGGAALVTAGTVAPISCPVWDTRTPQGRQNTPCPAHKPQPPNLPGGGTREPDTWLGTGSAK